MYGGFYSCSTNEPERGCVGSSDGGGLRYNEGQQGRTGARASCGRFESLALSTEAAAEGENKWKQLVLHVLTAQAPALTC